MRDVEKWVGIAEQEIEVVNNTINIDITRRTWGFAASVQTLIKVPILRCQYPALLAFVII